MRTKTHLKTFLVIAVFFVALLGMSWPARAVPWVIRRLTDNSYMEFGPQISGANVVWQAQVGGVGNDFEIFFWDGTTISQLTDNSYDDLVPQISGSNVVWEAQVGGVGNDFEIFFWDGTTISQLTDNSYYDRYPQISGSNVVWQGYNGNWEIFFWNAISMGEPFQVTVDIYGDNDVNPQISGSNVVWQALVDGTHYEIFFWDGTTIRQLTDNSYYDVNPQISGSNVVWQSLNAGTEYEIFFWDVISMIEPYQVTDNSYHDFMPHVSGSNMGWYGFDGSDYEIFFWDGTTITQVTDNSYDDGSPQLSGSNVIWSGYQGYDYEIFFWDGTTISQLTDNSYDDRNVRISGSNVVWQSYNGDDMEIFIASPYQIPITIYVDANATGANNGSSWTNAYNYLQDALADANSSSKPVEIWVAEGTYKPDEDEGGNVTPNDRTETFQLINGVAIYGGFVGTETSLEERDPNAYETILSGDLLGNDQPNFVNNSENSYHVVNGSGTDETTIIDGFIITGGNANDPNLHEPGSYGGGMYNNSGSPTVTNCTFSENSANYGGGIHNDQSSPKVTNCTFSGNKANNRAGGMDNDMASPTVINCIFIANYGGSGGGGMDNYMGSPTVINCIFRGNSASTGGGMANASSPTVINCTFTGNSAGLYGGGMANAVLSPMVTNCSFSGNSANIRGGGMLNDYSGSPTLTNCILWGNTAMNGPQIALKRNSSVTISYCDMQGGQTAIDNDGTGSINWGTGNIDADPDFVRNADDGGDGWGVGDNDDFGDLHLQPGSPCIDVGDNTAVPTGVTTDLAGNPRILNGIVDMGAYEGGYPAGRTLTVSATSGGSVTTPGEGSFPYDYGEVVQIIAQAEADNWFVEWTGTAVDAGKVANPTAASTTVTMHGDYTLVANFAAGTIIYVDADAAGGGDGTSWADAYINLQDALVYAISRDEIYVAEGIYKPDQGAGLTPGDRTATFQLKNDVAIYGGYAGFGEPDPNGRDIDAYKTILSGDLAGDDVGFTNNGENSYHVVTGSGTEPNTILDGFTITGGNANGSGTDMAGGGMINQPNGNPTITNCKFGGNSAGYGGGIRNFDHSSPTLTNCHLKGNSASSGGGMYNGYYSTPTLTNCTFSGNTASSGGGGMLNHLGSDATVTNCTFSGNSAGNGGGMYNYNNSPTLTNCILWGNSDGGGMDESAQIYNASSTPVINYCCVQGWIGGLGGTGNIGDDPLFVDSNGPDDIFGTEDDNLRLLADSNCIDTGNNSAVPAGVTTDLDGHPRIVDGDGNITALVDMGAYEFNWAYIGDFDGDYDVDFADLAIFALAFLTEPGDAGWNPDCDISIPADNSIDLRDLDVISDNWPARARFSPIPHLLFSEYVEGFGYNQAVEIYNAGDVEVYLGACQVRIYNNGSFSPLYTVPLNAVTLLPGEVFVLGHPGISVPSFCDQLSAGLSFSGNDAIELVYQGAPHDVIGQIGFDPGYLLGWGSGGITTLDHTLRRKCSVSTGDWFGYDSFDPAVEWEAFPVNTFDGLGSHCQ